MALVLRVVSRIFRTFCHKSSLVMVDIPDTPMGLVDLIEALAPLRARTRLSTLPYCKTHTQGFTVGLRRHQYPNSAWNVGAACLQVPYGIIAAVFLRMLRTALTSFAKLKVVHVHNHSVLILSNPLHKNWRSPIHALIDPNTPSAIHILRV